MDSQLSEASEYFNAKIVMKIESFNNENNFIFPVFAKSKIQNL